MHNLEINVISISGEHIVKLQANAPTFNEPLSSRFLFASKLEVRVTKDSNTVWFVRPCRPENAP